MKKIVGTAFSLVGAVIGAGMMTGAEIKQYFGSGMWAFAGIVISCTGMAFIFLCLLDFCNKNNTNSIIDLGHNLFGKHYKVFAAFISMGIVSCAGAMLAGTGELFFELLGIQPIYIAVAIAVVGSICAYHGIKWIKRINIFAVPFILLFITVILLTRKIDYHLINDGKIHGCFIFSLYNASLALPLCCSIEKMNAKQLRSAVLLFAILTAAVMLLISILISQSDENVNLPLFNVIANLSGTLGVIYAFALFLASGTTYISVMVVYKQNKLAMIFATLSALFISILEIKNIVKYVYPITGFLCIICLIRILILRIKV